MQFMWKIQELFLAMPGPPNATEMDPEHMVWAPKIFTLFILYLIPTISDIFMLLSYYFLLLENIINHTDHIINVKLIFKICHFKFV